MKTKKPDLPIEFLKITDSLDLEVSKVLLYNKRKESATLQVSRKNEFNRKLILKCISKNTPDVEKVRFKNEIFYYSSYKGPRISPENIDSGSRYLLLEYIEGVTLRKKLIGYLNHELSTSEKNELYRLLDIIIDQILDHYNEILLLSNEKKFIKHQDAVENLMSIYSKLAASGPFSTRRSKLAVFISKLLYFFTKGDVEQKISDILCEDVELLKSGFTHQDLHLDNILVSNNNDVFIIDYANYRDNGLILQDLVYYLATMLTLLEPNQEIKKYFIKILFAKTDTLQAPFKKVISIACIFHVISNTNSRFNSVSGMLSIIKSYLFFFNRLYKQLNFYSCSS